MKFLSKILLPVLSFLVFLPCNAMAFDNTYLLKRGNLERDAGNRKAAIHSYKEYITTHPASQEKTPPAYHEKEQYYISNLLKAYASLLRLFETGRQREAIAWMRKLQQIHEAHPFCSKNKYNLAEIFHEHGNTEKAVALLKEIVREQKANFSEDNIKVTIRSYKMLFEIYQRLNEHGQAAALAESLRSLNQSGFDVKDKYRLAILHIEHGSKADGIRVFKELIQNQDRVNSANFHTLVRTYKTLAEHNENKVAHLLLAKIKQTHSRALLSSHERYKLALLFLNAHEEKEGVALLKRIKEERSLNSRKALFVLGRVAASNQDWNAAVRCYDEYIEKYADHSSFFTLKAYSRLIDAYWARGDDRDAVQRHAEQLADIVNRISDYKTQFILARDFKQKGMDALASSTFNIALAAAKDVISNDRDACGALEARFLIQRYGCAMGRFELVKKHARQALESIKKMDFQHNTPERIERVNYIKSQSYLWLAESSSGQKNYASEINYLNSFLNHFPDSKDVDYARYRLGRAYERMGRKADAIKILQKIDKGNMWQKQAREVLKEVDIEKQ